MNFEDRYIIHVDDIVNILTKIGITERQIALDALCEKQLTSLGRIIARHIDNSRYVRPSPEYAHRLIRYARAEHLLVRLRHQYADWPVSTPVPLLYDNKGAYMHATISLGAVTETELWEALRVANMLMSKRSALSSAQSFKPKTCGVITRVLRRQWIQGTKTPVLNSKWEYLYLLLLKANTHRFAQANLEKAIRLTRFLIQFFGPSEVKAAIQLCRAAPKMPFIMVKRYVRLSRESRIIAAGLFNKEWAEHKMNAQARMEFEFALAQTINGSPAHRRAMFVRYAPYVMSHGKGIDFILKSGADTPALRKAGLTRETALGFKLSAWRKLKANSEIQDFLHMEAGANVWLINAVRVFGNETVEFIRRQRALGRSLHDSLYWLYDVTPCKGLASLLFANLNRDTTELALVANSYARLKPSQKSDKWTKILTAIRVGIYENARHVGWAEECAKWGVSKELYRRFEQLYLESLLVSEFVPQLVGKVWEADKVRGFFLPRADVRGPWLGQYTSCCQHLLGAGASCAEHGQLNPDGGFFVVMYNNEIVAQSWCHRHWLKGSKPPRIVFDNVEKSMKESLSASCIQQVYKAAALALSELGYDVSTGTVTDIEIGTEACDALYPPYYYSDAGRQVWVARACAGVIPPKPALSICKSDPLSCHFIAKQVYPTGWQFISIPKDGEYYEVWKFETNRTLFGYIVLGQKDKNPYIFDLAILPKYRHHTPEVLGRMMVYMQGAFGNTWTADCRASTSYQTLIKGASKGYYRIISDTPSEAHMDGQAMRHVVFEIVDSSHS